MLTHLILTGSRGEALFLLFYKIGKLRPREVKVLKQGARAGNVAGTKPSRAFALNPSYVIFLHILASYSCVLLFSFFGLLSSPSVPK